MRSTSIDLKLAAIVIAPLVFSGCTAPPPQSADVPVEHEHEGAHGHEEHGSTGPHGGQLIELGRNHEYHAELVEGDSHDHVKLYLLDHDLEPLSAQADSVSLLVTAGERSLTVNLAADESDGSVFSGSDPALARLLETGEDVAGKLRVTIDGVPHSGEWRHEDHQHDNPFSH